MTSSDRPLLMSIEDNRDTQQLIERLLSGRGYDAVIADNGLKGTNIHVGRASNSSLRIFDRAKSNESSRRSQQTSDLTLRLRG
jgi:CheY-like chemotaxis protein